MARPRRRGWILAPRTAATNKGRQVHVGLQNRGALARLLAVDPEDRLLIIVPGYTPLKTEVPIRLHRVTRRRLKLGIRALEELGAQAMLLTGGNVHPADTPFNEACQMKRYLRRTLKVPLDRLLIEPYARHSTTNLRNVGRFMLTHAVPRCVVVSTWGQSFYFGNHTISGFTKRCREELGYDLGHIDALTGHRTGFVPAEGVWTEGDDPLDP